MGNFHKYPKAFVIICEYLNVFNLRFQELKTSSSKVPKIHHKVNWNVVLGLWKLLWLLWPWINELCSVEFIEKLAFVAAHSTYSCGLGISHIPSGGRLPSSSPIQNGVINIGSCILDLLLLLTNFVERNVNMVTGVEDTR